MTERNRRGPRATPARPKRPRLGPSIELLQFYVDFCRYITEQNRRATLNKVAIRLRRSSGFVSGCLKKLEDRYRDGLAAAAREGAPELVTRGPVVALTVRGRELYRLAIAVLEAHGRLREWPAAAAGGRREELVITASNFILRTYLPAVVARYVDAGAACDLRFLENTSRDELIEHLRAGVARFGIGERAAPGTYPGYTCRPIAAGYQVYLIAREELGIRGRATLADLRPHVVCLIAADRVGPLEDLSPSVRGLVTVQNYSALSPLVQAGVGVGIVSLVSGPFLPKDLRAYPLDLGREFSARWQLGLWTRSAGDLAWPPAREFLRCLEGLAKKGPAPPGR